MPEVFEQLRTAGFDVRTTYHADAILYEDFSDAVDELETALLGIDIPIEELVRGGGGEAKITQRLRRSLSELGWRKTNFRVEKKINRRVTLSQSHEVDHSKQFEKGLIALEIEWNNKDPFFDRDLENFNRLHSDGAISVGIIVTRGRSLQDGLISTIKLFAENNKINSFAALNKFGVSPTKRQRQLVKTSMSTGSKEFADAWSSAFISDKFGSATTHWKKLESRLERGVGSPCPLVAVGIPLSKVSGAASPE